MLEAFRTRAVPTLLTTVSRTLHIVRLTDLVQVTPTVSRVIRPAISGFFVL